MAYNTIDNVTTANLTGILQYPSTNHGIFWPVILFVIYVVIALYSLNKETDREGRANILPSLALAGFVTTAIAVIFSLMGLIINAVLIIVFVISMVFIVLYLLTGRNR